MNQPPIKVTVSVITERGVFPQFYQTFWHDVLADEYSKEMKSLAAKAGVMVRIDKETTQPQKEN